MSRGQQVVSPVTGGSICRGVGLNGGVRKESTGGGEGAI